MTRSEILHEAEKCVCTDREQEYGSPEDNFAVIADLWSNYLHARCKAEGGKAKITAHNVAIMMALLKIGRMASGQVKGDNYVDAVGYLSIGGELSGERAK